LLTISLLWVLIMPLSTVGYHTCLNVGSATEIEQKAPFKAQHDPFLSEGCYFWEHSESAAHYWGGTARFKQAGYVVCRCELCLNSILDLAGNPLQINEFLALEQVLEECNRLPAAKLPIAKLIETLRDLDATDMPGVFPYDSVRIRLEPAEKQQDLRPFTASARTGKGLILNPRFVICVFAETTSPLRPPQVLTCEIIFPKTVQHD